MAIKSTKALKQCDTDDFLDEAKSMLEIDAYHENIVNLQGITYEISTASQHKVEVSNYKNGVFRLTPLYLKSSDIFQ